MMPAFINYLNITIQIEIPISKTSHRPKAKVDFLTKIIKKTFPL